MNTEQKQKGGFAHWLCRKSLLPLVIDIGACFALRNLLWGLTAGYFLNSLWIMFFYYADKKAAVNESERIPEACLHLWEFFGGWPGALAARSIFHHKNKKFSYRIVFWLIVFLNILTLLSVIQYHKYGNFPWYSCFFSIILQKSS